MYFKPGLLHCLEDLLEFLNRHAAGTALITCLPAFSDSMAIQACKGNGVQDRHCFQSRMLKHFANFLYVELL